MSQNLQDFIAANAKSPVVAGSVIGDGGEGAFYTLSNGRTFSLTADECGLVSPRWKLPALTGETGGAL